MANRLSADPNNKVLLLEAGGKDDYIWIHIPIGYLFTMGNPRTDWCFRTEPQRFLGGAGYPYPRGKVLGGCSSINGMIYQRGNMADYDAWGKDNPGWGWEHVFPAFHGMVDYHAGETPDAGVGGEWRVEPQRMSWEILDRFADAAVERGIPRREHLIDSNSEGVGLYKVNQRSGVRLSAYRAFVRNRGVQRERSNLRVVTGAEVKRLVVSGSCVAGVEFALPDGRLHRVEPTGETVLCAGAIGSPHLLQVSGVGNPELLAQHGVTALHELPGVGENLQDHLQLRPSFRLKSDTVTLNKFANSWSGKARIGAQYFSSRTGPMSSAPSQLGVFAKSSPDLAFPDLQYHIQPLSLDRFGQPLHKWPGLTTSVCNLRPTSRGSVRLRSPDARVPPAIDPRYLSTEEDRRIAVASLRHARRLVGAECFRRFEPVEHAPGAAAQSDEELLEAAAGVASTIFHPVGTCKMGPASDPGAVVGADLRVHGLEGIRVVDASIMPSIVSGNTNSPTLMIAQRASEMILGRVCAGGDGDSSSGGGPKLEVAADA